MESAQQTINNGNRLSADKRRRQLTQVAIRFFSERGFNGTTTKEIAAATGVSEAVIYQHFSTKEDFYTSVLDENTKHIFSHRWLDSLKEYTDKNQDVELFQAIGKKILEFAGQTDLVRLVLYSALERHELAQIFRVKQLLPIFEILRGYIEKRQSEGKFQKIDADTAARGFIGMLTYHAVVGNLFPCTPFHISDEEVIENFTRLTLTGLRLSETPNLTDTIF